MIRKAMMSEVKELSKLYKETIDRNKSTMQAKIYIKRLVRSGNVMVLITDKIIGAYIFIVSRKPNPYVHRRGKKDIVWLEQVMVFPEEQGKGYGKELIDDFLGLSTGEHRLICSEDLLAFYEKFNFKVEELVNEKRELRYIMKRESI